MPSTGQSGPEFRCPLIAELHESLAIDPRDALARFWATVEERGTPLVDPIPESPALVLVTFVWRSDEPIDNVALIENFSVVDPRGTVLERIGETNVWYRSFVMHADLRFTYEYSVNDSLISVYEDPNPGERWARFRSDPLNPDTSDFAAMALYGLPPNETRESYVELPNAAPQPHLVYRPEIARGRFVSHRWQSAALGTDRSLQVYLPAGYEPETGEPSLLIVFDGERALDHLGASVTLDNLIAGGLIPPTVAVLVTSEDRSIEYPCNAAFAAAIAGELVPDLRDAFGVTADPARVIASGISYGGLASAWLALTHPDVVGNALSQSGSFQWRVGTGRIARDKTDIVGDAPAYGWLAGQVATWEPRPIRLYVSAGRLEALNSGGEPSLLAATRHFRDVLTAKGYEFAYHEYGGAHDYVNWRGGFADGLIYLNR